MITSKFNIVTPSWMPDSIILYNSFTGSNISLSNKDYIIIKKLFNLFPKQLSKIELNNDLIQKLINGGFIIKDDYNENAEILSRYFSVSHRSSGLSLTISPTVACNLRCGYCFEKHPNRKMNEIDINSIINYVDQNLISNSSLSVTWFGGEPLMMKNTIIELGGKFKEISNNKQSNFHQSIVTNGVLLNEKFAREINNVGDVGTIQITLDGPPEIHNKRRPTISGKGTFEKILSNIIECCELLTIQIRINVDKTNYLRLEKLLRILKKNDLAGKISIYLGHTYSYSETQSKSNSSQLTIPEFASIQAQFEVLLLRYGFKLETKVPQPDFGTNCVADNPNGVVISPNGLIFKCWNETAVGEEYSLGSMLTNKSNGTIPQQNSSVPSHGVSQNSTQIENDKKWNNIDPFTHKECTNCKVKPLCRGGCHWEARNNPEDGPGHCTPLRYNIEDILRVNHLNSTLSLAIKSGSLKKELKPLCHE